MSSYPVIKADAPKDAHEEEFEAFIQKFGKSYASADDRQAHFEIFKANLLFIESENAKGLTYKLAVNAFADQSAESFTNQRLGLSLPVSPKLWAGMPHLGTDASVVQLCPSLSIGTTRAP